MFPDIMQKATTWESRYQRLWASALYLLMSLITNPLTYDLILAMNKALVGSA